MYTDVDRNHVFDDVDLALGSICAWLIPRFRGGLLATRDVVEWVLGSSPDAEAAAGDGYHDGADRAAG